MRKIREVMRLSLGHGLSSRQVARSCRIARSTVGEYLRRAKKAGLSWPLPEGLDDGRLEQMLFPPALQHLDPSSHLRLPPYRTSAIRSLAMTFPSIAIWTKHTPRETRCSITVLLLPGQCRSCTPGLTVASFKLLPDGQLPVAATLSSRSPTKRTTAY